MSTLRSETSAALPAHPRREFVPCVDSPRWEACSPEVQAFWRSIQQTVCGYCSKAIGEASWVLVWPDGRAAHLGCQDDAIAAEHELANNPWWSERAAAASKMTIAAFRDLSSWERLRLIRQAQESGIGRI